MRARCPAAARTAVVLLTAGALGLSVTIVPLCAVSRETEPPTPIVVNSTTPSTGDRIDLARALALAAEDPRDNVIQFGEAIPRGNVVIALTKPIEPTAAAGHDAVIGPEGGTIVLDAASCPDAGLIVGGDASFELRNITLRGGEQRTVLLKDNAHLEMEGVTLTSRAGPGVAAFGSSRLKMSDCRLSGHPTHGIELHGETAVRLDRVEIADCGQSGMAGFEAARITARQCRLHRNGHWNVVLTGRAVAEIDDCTLSGARFANIDIGEASELSLRRGTVEKGDRFGLFATGDARVRVDSTAIRHHAGRGVEMQSRATIELTSAELDGNGDYGIILFEQCAITAVACKFTRNQGHGASLRGKAAGTFKACLFAGNRYSGLGCLDARDGGAVLATQCIFRSNGMRPIYRGPLHLDPLVPTPLTIDSESVECLTDPNAVVELYFDRAGEAGRYFKTIRADQEGRFRVRRSDVPEGWVMTAAATVDGSTSEFNVVAGSQSADVMAALLAQTGPLSDSGGAADLEGGLRHWRGGTTVALHIDNPPSVAIERYARFLTRQVVHWTRGAVTAELSIGDGTPNQHRAVVVPVTYMPPDAEPLFGRGGVTFMKWDGQGYFMPPMKILLADGKENCEACPRVLAHEFGHVLGLCHARVGLLSRMQGSIPPSKAFVNDFAPMLTFYDVLALHMLHDAPREAPSTLRRALAAIPQTPGSTAVASVQPDTAQPTYSPPANEPPEPQAPSIERP